RRDARARARETADRDGARALRAELRALERGVPLERRDAQGVRRRVEHRERAAVDRRDARDVRAAAVVVLAGAVRLHVTEPADVRVELRERDLVLVFRRRAVAAALRLDDDLLRRGLAGLRVDDPARGAVGRRAVVAVGPAARGLIRA